LATRIRSPASNACDRAPPAVEQLARQREWAERKCERAVERQRYRAAYHAYLESPTWGRKRQAKLLQARFLCESCLERPATQVHHRTYPPFGVWPDTPAWVAWETLGTLSAIFATVPWPCSRPYLAHRRPLMTRERYECERRMTACAAAMELADLREIIRVFSIRLASVELELLARREESEQEPCRYR
jgi:hypothetical protein